MTSAASCLNRDVMKLRSCLLKLQGVPGEDTSQTEGNVDSKIIKGSG